MSTDSLERWRPIPGYEGYYVPSAAHDDGTTEWWSDLEYMRALADEIFTAAKVTPGAARGVGAV